MNAKAHHLLEVALSPISRAITGLAGHRKIILCYHSVHPTAKFRSVTPHEFEKQVAWLSENSKVLRPDDLIDAKPESKLPHVSITFDDGYADNYTYAFKICQAYGVPFGIYPTLGLIENDEYAKSRYLDLLKDRRESFDALTWKQLEEMHAAGIEIGSHSWDHPSLASLSDDNLDWQLGHSKALLESRLGIRKVGIAYPFGKRGRHVTPREAAATLKLGYSYGACIEHRAVAPNEDRFMLPRFIINKGSLHFISSVVKGNLDYLGWMQKHIPASFAKPFSPEDFTEQSRPD